MDTLLDAIRAAIAPSASDETKTAGASACRVILTALEAKPGVPLITERESTQQLTNLGSLLRGIPIDQVLDLAIAKLRAALPAGSAVAPVGRLNVPLVALPQVGRKP